MNPAPGPASLRVFLFKREFVDVFHLRLAIGMAFLGSAVSVLDQNEVGMRAACEIVRSGDPVPSLILVEQTRREVPGHGSSAEEGLCFAVSVRVDLREELFDGEKVQRKHECLVPIVTGTEVAFAERVGESQLRGFLAITKNPELCFS